MNNGIDSISRVEIQHCFINLALRVVDDLIQPLGASSWHAPTH